MSHYKEWGGSVVVKEKDIYIILLREKIRWYNPVFLKQTLCAGVCLSTHLYFCPQRKGIQKGTSQNVNCVISGKWVGVVIQRFLI